MQGTQTQPDPEAAAGDRWMFGYSVQGDLRFISHHDTLRLFRRALARAALPVRYSEGFNPHARVSIPLPRPVGVASDAEALVVDFRERVDGDVAIERLGRQMPEGIKLLGARRLDAGNQPLPAFVRYRLDLDGAPLEVVKAHAARTMASDVVEVERVRHKDQRHRRINVRPLITDLHVAETGVEFRVRVTNCGSVKAAEVAGLLGFDSHAINHRIRRLDVQWEYHNRRNNPADFNKENCKATTT